MSSPTQRSLKALRDTGYRAQVVEKYNQFARVRQDLFGIIDIVAIKPKHLFECIDCESYACDRCDGCGYTITPAQTLGVQTTSYSNMSARIKKIKEAEAFPDLLAAGWIIVVHGWRKNKSKRWELVERICEAPASESVTTAK